MGVDPDILLIIVLIEKAKGERLVLWEVGKAITPMPLDEFFDCLSCIEKDTVWWSYKMEYLVGKVLKSLHIWTQDEYTKFIRKLSRQPEVKKKVFLRLANVEKDEEKEEIFKLQG